MVENFEPRVIAFCCHYCAYSAADLAGSMRLEYPPNVRIVKTMCTGKVEPAYLLKAFEDGIDAAFVAG
jgi:coenzyme F420-reducing hydrogenase delta subunit